MDCLVKKDRTFLFFAFEGLRSDAQDSVPLLTTSSIFAPTAAQGPILAGLVAEGQTPVPCRAKRLRSRYYLPPPALLDCRASSRLTLRPPGIHS